MGSAAAWFLTAQPGFDGSILVVDRDLSFANSATAHTTSCIRQQFSTDLNVRISQFGAEFIKNLGHCMQAEGDVPQLAIRSFGYMYLAETDQQVANLRNNHAVQVQAGAETRLLAPSDVLELYPFYNVADVQLASLNTRDEGYFDSWALFDSLKRQAQKRGVEYIENEVVNLHHDAGGQRLAAVSLSSGERVHCGAVINAAGPRAAQLARMAEIALPVEPRKRFSWIFKAERPLDRDLPLTIDPSGIHVRENGGGTYQAGGHHGVDPAVDPNDFRMDHSLWQDHVWPILAHRIPQFEAIRVQSEWAGHYEMNTLDQNAIVGPHPNLQNFLFMNGFSGHGLQQAPAMGRAIAEWMTHGAYQTLNMSPFHFDRITQQNPLVEAAVI